MAAAASVTLASAVALIEPAAAAENLTSRLGKAWVNSYFLFHFSLLTYLKYIRNILGQLYSQSWI